MGFLKDVAYPHVYQDQARTRSAAHVMHPYTNSSGEHQGKYAILRVLDKGTKLSGYVVDAQLAELFAHDCFQVYKIRLRMKDLAGAYPSAPPGLQPNQEHVIPGSDFAHAVTRIDTRAPLSSELKSILRTLDVHL